MIPVYIILDVQFFLVMGEKILCKIDRLGLILFSIVGFDSLDLDDDCGISLGEGLAFCCDSTGYITRGKSQCHRNRCSNSQCEVLDSLDKALFLCVS